MDCKRTLCPPVLRYLQEFAQIHVHWVNDAIQPSHPLHPLLLQSSIFPSIRVFFNELALCIRWPKYWNFDFSISPSNEYLGWISLRIHWIDLLDIQGTFKSLLQHHGLKGSVIQRSAFFIFFICAWLLENWHISLVLSSWCIFLSGLFIQSFSCLCWTFNIKSTFIPQYC